MVSFLFFFITDDIPVEELKEKYADQYSRFIEIDGMQVHYREEGQGMPILLMHGTSASLHTWDSWTTRLKQEYKVIRLDLPAYGLTGPHPLHDYRTESYADFLDQFLTELSIDSLYLVGNSLGGNIAWYYTAEHPEKVKKLVLIDPSGYSGDAKQLWVFKLAQIPVLNSIIRYITPRSMVEKLLKEVYFDDSKITPDLVNRYYDLALREGNRAAFINRAKTDVKDHTAKLKQIHAPTLIIWGKEDSWIPVSNGDRFLSDIPNAKLVVLENEGHIPMEESPRESLRPVLQFFK